MDLVLSYPPLPIFDSFELTLQDRIIYLQIEQRRIERGQLMDGVGDAFHRLANQSLVLRSERALLEFDQQAAGLIQHGRRRTCFRNPYQLPLPARRQLTHMDVSRPYDTMVPVAVH